MSFQNIDMLLVNMLLNILNEQELFLISELVELTICDLFVIDIWGFILTKDCASSEGYR